MSDPSLSRPPFIPEGTFRCCLCFEVFPVEAAYKDSKGVSWDCCAPCVRGEEEANEAAGGT